MQLQTLWNVVYALLFAAFCSFILAIRPIQDKQLVNPSFTEKFLPAFINAILLILVVISLTLGMMFQFEVNLVFAVGLSLVVVITIYPMIIDYRERQYKKKLRQEGISIAEFIAGRMLNDSTMFNALSELYEEYESGQRHLHLSGEDLRELILTVRAGQRLSEGIGILASKYDQYPGFAQIWESYQLIVDLSLNSDAKALQAEDVSTTQDLMDELKNTMDTELSTSVSTRLVMFGLIGGLAFFLTFFSPFGPILTGTLPGNLVVLATLLGILLSQYVGRQLEKMPLLEF